MATIERFEDLEVWKKARMLSKNIYAFTFKGPLSKDFELRGQIRSSSGSVMDNIAEGFERGGKAEFINFLIIAKGSCGEVRSQLYRLIDNEYISNKDFEDFYQLSVEISKMLNGLIQYLKKSDIKGFRYKELE